MNGWIAGIGLALAMALVGATGGAAGGVAGPLPDGMAGADVVLLGEVHDNPDHHATQAGLVAALAPRALVFEMLTEVRAQKVTPELRADRDALAAALDWDHGGWPDFAMYYPLFTAAPGAVIRGAAVPRPEARAAMEAGIAAAFGGEAGAYGLDRPLSEADQAGREAFQHAAHCEALPGEMLPVMVDLQRLRDAVLARAALRALDETGGPVVVITGNGHARRDWGVPVYLAHARPGVGIFALGQTEDGAEPEGQFDAVLDAPGAERDDPCEVFRKN